MTSQPHPCRPGHWACCWRCGLSCGVFGILTGPIAMFGAMSLENYLHGTVFLGLELIGAPIFGAVLGLIEGAVVGLVWAHFKAPDRRLTIAHLMLFVAIAGPTLALFVASPFLALLIGLNGVLLLPFAAMVLYGLRDGTPVPEQDKMPKEATSVPTPNPSGPRGENEASTMDIP